MSRHTTLHIRRRTALRYLAIGAAASLVSACGGNGADGGPRRQAVKAFVVGRWHYRAQGTSADATLTVHKDGTWESDQWDGITGTWDSDGDGVSVDAPNGFAESREEMSALSVSGFPGAIPSDFDGDCAYAPGWDGLSADTLHIRVTGRDVRLTLSRGGGKGSVINCKRL
ncbi:MULTISPECIES: hypothetical protein [unclassified Streptomyces]|uniref:hypothetical protein n=1 Tax=unclassified Streptomyces TaxID=2593676 RepID=UPI00382456F1